jgi:hypothetical protein
LSIVDVAQAHFVTPRASRYLQERDRKAQLSQ